MEEHRRMAAVAPTELQQVETLGSVLARRRLEHRAVRLRLVLLALQQRSKSYARSGAVPVSLRHAITDFSAELARVQCGLSGSITDWEGPEPEYGGVHRRKGTA